MKTHTIQNNFTAGELSPDLLGRADLKAYHQGAALVRNFIPRRTGGLSKRPGTRLIDLGISPTAFCIPFFYDTEHSWIIVVDSWGSSTNARARFINCQTEEYQLNPNSTVAQLDLAGVTMSHVTAYFSGASSNYPYHPLRFRQAGDTIFLTAPGLTPRRIVRNANGTWSYYGTETRSAPPAASDAEIRSATNNRIIIDILNDQPPGYNYATYGYAIFEQADGLLTLCDTASKQAVGPWPAGGEITLSCRINVYHPGSRFIVAKRWGAGYGIIGDYWQQTPWTSGQTYEDFSFKDSNILPDTQVPWQTVIRTAAEDSAGYGLMEFYQQRTVLAGNSSAPFRLWFSQLADLYGWHTDRPADDSNPFSAAMPAVKAAGILHLIADRRLILLTEDGAFSVHSGADGFSARTCRIERASRVPASRVPPITGQNSVIYVAADMRRLIEMRYDWTQDGFQTMDRSVLAGHLTENTIIRSIAWQEFPDSVIWVVLHSGALLSFTYMPEHGVYAWARHSVNAHFPVYDGTSVYITDIFATGAVKAGRSEMWMKLAWTDPESEAHSCLLRLAPPAESDAPDPDNPNLDIITAAAATAAAPVTPPAGSLFRSITAGVATPWAPSDGQPVAPPAGVYTMRVEYGMPIAAELRTLPPALPDRPISDTRKTVLDASLRVRRCGTLHVTRPGEPLSAPTLPAPSADALHSGTVRALAHGLWDRDGTIAVTSSDHLPCEILSLITTLQTE